MDSASVRALLDSAEEAEQQLRPLGFADPAAAQANLVRIATAGVPLDLLASLWEQLVQCVPRLGRSGFGAEQFGALHPGVSQSVGGGGAVRSGSRGAAAAAAVDERQPGAEQSVGE